MNSQRLTYLLYVQHIPGPLLPVWSGGSWKNLGCLLGVLLGLFAKLTMCDDGTHR